VSAGRREGGKEGRRKLNDIEERRLIITIQ